MTKRLEITPKIAAEIARSTDNSVDPNSVAVFETISLNTLPLSQRGNLFERAVVTESTLRQMAEYLNNGTNYAPLHQIHDQAEALPVGRTFYGEVLLNENGLPELRTLFYLPLTELDLISKLETAVIDEVSVGLQTEHINCSECGWDYRGADSTWSNKWSRTCANDHEIGVNGVHTILSGMESFKEQSLVSRGAANNARIMGRTKALLGAEKYQQLAASGGIPEATFLFATTTKTKPERPMDPTMIAELSNAKADSIVKTAALAAAQVTIDSLTTENTTLKASVESLKSAQGSLDTLNAATANLETATAYLRSEADRLAIAASMTKPAADATTETLIASIKDCRTKLEANTPTGGVTNPQGGNQASALSIPPSVFKSR